MKNIFLSTIIFFSLICVFTTCKKRFDTPPVKSIEEISKINIAILKAKYKDGFSYKFKADSSLYCVVTADEVSGNLYKEIYVKDATGALHVRLTNKSSLFIGDSIRINIKGATLNDDDDLIQLDSVDSETSVVKLASGYNPVPWSVTIKQLLANVAPTNSLQSRLVKLDGVEFDKNDQNEPYADASGKVSLDKVLRYCGGTETVVVRTSGYASFASKNTPGGNGSMVAIVSEFRGKIQLILRNLNDVNMVGTNCPPPPTPTVPASYLFKDFNDGDLFSDGWINANATGTINWVIATATTNPTKFGQCNNFISSGNQPACETWLISKAMDLSKSTSPTYSFTSAFLFTGPTLSTMISTNYNAGAPSTATWTALTATFGTSSTFKSSGLINLSAYKTSNVRVAFKYVGNVGSGSRWQIDDIRVYEP